MEMINYLTDTIQTLESWNNLTKLSDVADSKLIKDMTLNFEIMKDDVVLMAQCLILYSYNKDEEELDKFHYYRKEFSERNTQLAYDLQLLWRYNYEGLSPKEFMKAKYMDNHFLQLNDVYDVLVEEVLC